MISKPNQQRLPDAPMQDMLRRAAGLVLVAQPIPSAVAAASVGFFALVAAAASHAPPDPGKLVRLVAAILFCQFAIGAVNDYHDVAVDATTTRLKPIVRGWISRSDALVVAGVATAVALACAASLGLPTAALIVVVEVLGLAYDLRFKGTAMSAVLYSIGFPLSPLLAWTVFGHYQPFLPWILPFGVALGLAMNIANSLPDLEADRQAGVRGLPHLLGMRRGLVLALITPPLAALVMLALSLVRWVPAHPLGLLVAILAGLLAALVPLILYLLRPTPSILRTNFYIQALGVIALATAWFAAVAL